MLRIIAGEYRSRQLQTPPGGDVTRPYAQRVKESLFNRLRGWCEDANVLDLFAGVGTMGLEAASRGAAQVVMVERDLKVFRLMQENIDALGCGDRVVAVHGDALGPVALHQAPAPVDLVFVDPPYRMLTEDASRESVLDQVGRCVSVMRAESLLVLRGPEGPDALPLDAPGMTGPEAHRYGPAMWVMLYEPESAGP